MTDRTPTGDLPDECTGCGRDDGPMYLDPRPRHPRDPQAADAVLSVVEAETAALRQRAEEAERERDDYRQRFANQMTAATELTTTLREAERKLQQALEAIAAERRGRLTAEAAVRRARELADHAEMTADVIDPDGERIQFAAVAVRDLRAALDAERPKETPTCCWFDGDRCMTHGADRPEETS